MSLIVEKISLSYGKKQILAPVSFTVERGEIVTLFGPSGVGKTSLLKMIAGIQVLSSGKLTFTAEFTQSDTVLVFQDFWLFPHMTVVENIAFGLRARKVKKIVIKQRVAEMIKRFELTGLEEHYPDQLSGGQQQRVALARAIVLQPKLLLLDEPFSSLDSNLRLAMRNYLLELKAEYGFGVIMVTHDKDEAFYLSDRLVVIIDGQIQQIAPPKTIYYEPANRKVADFVGEMNYLTGEFFEGTFKVADTKLVLQTLPQNSGPAELLIPYETSVSFGTGVAATVKKVTWQPSGNQVVFEIDGQSVVLNGITEELVVGSTVTVQLPPDLKVISQ